MKFPWKGIAIGSGVLVALVVIRCIVTMERAIYYGTTYGLRLVMQDPWLYVGIGSAAVCAAALLIIVDDRLKKEKEKENDGCE